ncbi:MAG: hypothetical protein NTW19_14840 [Planctomycetota bacterium]|nr:hypothetical protein [Planctomycetota bacterium]
MEEDLVLGGFIAAPLLGILAIHLFFKRLRRTPGQPVGWLRLVAGNVLILAVGCSMVLLAGECYCRFFVDTTDAYGRSKINQRWIDRHWHENAIGVRDSLDTYSPQRTAGKRRVTFMGDSFTAGHGVADVEDRFVNRVRRSRPAWEVHLFAENGMDTGEEVEAVRGSLASNYEWQQLVLVYNLNDIADITPEWAAVSKRVLTAPPPPFLFEHSYFLNTLHIRWTAWRDADLRRYFDFVNGAYNGPLWEQQKRRLTEMRDLMREHGGQLVVVTFPFLENLGPDYKYRDVHRRLDDFWRGLGVPHLDLLAILESHKGEHLVVNAHDPHPNERAHELAAEAILHFLDATPPASSQPAQTKPAPRE